MKSPVRNPSSKIKLTREFEDLDKPGTGNVFNLQRRSADKVSGVDINLLKTETNSLQSLKSKKPSSLARTKDSIPKSTEEEAKNSAYAALTSRFPTLAKERESVIMEIVNNIGTNKTRVNPTQILPNVTSLGLGRIKLKIFSFL